MRLLGRVFKHRPRDLASVNETKMCDYYSCIFYHLFYSNQIHTENVAQTLKYPFSYTGFPKQNTVSVKLSKVIASPQRHRVAQHFWAQKHRQNDQLRSQCFPV